RVKLSWMARPLPGTKILYGAGITCRIASPAYQRTKLHRRNGPTGGALRGLRNQLLGQSSLLRRRRWARQGNARTDSGQHAPNVGVQNDLPPTVREAADCRGRVGADSRQAEQCFAVLRD